MRGRLLALAAVVAGLAVLSAACSVVGDGKVDKVNPPFGLDDTIAPTTTEAPTTTAEATTTVPEQTTTTLVQTEQVRLYFVSGGQLVYVATPLASPVALPQIMAALQAGPPAGDLGVGLRSALPSEEDGQIVVTSNGAGVAIVQLPAKFFDNIAVNDQRLATAQIVLTLTDSRGIGQVQFNQQVPKPSGELTPAGQLLAKRDFQALLDSTTAPPEGSTTSGA